MVLGGGGGVVRKGTYLFCPFPPKLSTTKTPNLMPIVCPPISIPYDESPPTQSPPVGGNQSEKSLIQNQAFSKEWGGRRIEE